jgi:hypothetical protein
MDANASPANGDRSRPLLPEPPPIHALTRLTAYPWLVVCVACLGAFAGQVDASIVQLGLPTLENTFDTPLNEVSWVRGRLQPLLRRRAADLRASPRSPDAN